MKGKTKKTIFLIILVAVISAGTVGYYLFQKGPLDVLSAKAIPVLAVDLYQSFSKDSVAAKNTYTGNIVNVTGVLKEVTMNTQQQKVLLLQSGTEGANINCTMEGSTDELKAGATISVKGIASGMGQGEPDLGILGDVYLTRCYLSSGKE